jgi:pilus assembly protein CpaC
VSQLSTSGAITLNNITVPALVTRRAETTVELASGQSFAIAGLLQDTSTKDLQKFPGLGDLPILGQLFRSRNFQNGQSELVIIVTPFLVQPASRPLEMPMVAAPPAARPPAADQSPGDLIASPPPSGPPAEVTP